MNERSMQRTQADGKYCQYPVNRFHDPIYNNNKSLLLYAVYSKLSRSATHNPVSKVELTLKQNLKEVSIGAGVGSATAMLRRVCTVQSEI